MDRLQERLCAVIGLSLLILCRFRGFTALKHYPPRPSIRNLILRKRKGTKSISGDKIGLLRTNLWKVSGFLQLHASRCDAALQNLWRTAKVICGILRIETIFGIPRGFSPNPVGTILPLIGGDALLSPLPREKLSQHFPKVAGFALRQLKDLLKRPRNLAGTCSTQGL